MAVILNNKKSTYGSPYCFYTLEYTNTANRTADKVDITFKITSHLQYGNSSLGSGYTLKGQLYINGSWLSEISLKGSNDSWNGTSNHYKTATLTVTGLSSSDTTLSGIKFKVNSSAGDKACQLNATSCSNITIPMGHTPPDVVNGMWFEDETSPVYDIYNNIDRKTIVENLSIKRFIVAYNLSDNATISSVGIYNNIYPYSATTYEDDGSQVEYIIDFSNINLVKSANDNTKIPITTYITDSFGATNTDANYWGTGQELVSYIPYKPPTIIESDIIVKRARQITGNATISLNGTYYKSTDVLNQSGNIKVYYKYWENKENPVIPSTYTQIPTSSVTINNDGTFSVSDYVMGNDFDPEKSYRVLAKVSDAYKSYELSEPKSIAVGEALWTEYKDRVDFKKLTINKQNIIITDTFVETISSIASGGTTTLTYDITKAGYKPISISGYAVGNSAINVYGLQIISDTEAQMSVRNIYTATSTNINARIYVIYIKV